MKCLIKTIYHEEFCGEFPGCNSISDIREWLNVSDRSPFISIGCGSIIPISSIKIIESIREET